MANDTFTDEDLWQMRDESQMEPVTPFQDDVESVLKEYHAKMAELALAHQEEKERIFADRTAYTFVIINGKPCDPELDLSLSKLEGWKEQAQLEMKRICALKMASVLCYHLSHD